MQSKRETVQNVDRGQHNIQDNAVSAGTQLSDFSMAHLLSGDFQQQPAVGYSHCSHLVDPSGSETVSINIPQVKSNEHIVNFNDMASHRWHPDPHYRHCSYTSRWPHQDQFQSIMSAPFYSSESTCPTIFTNPSIPTIPGETASETSYSFVPHSSSTPLPGESSAHYSGYQSAMTLSQPSLYQYQPNLQEHPPPNYYDYTPIQYSNPATPSNPTSPHISIPPNTSGQYKRKYAGRRKGKGVCKGPADSNQHFNLNDFMPLPCSEPSPLSSGSSNTAMQPLAFSTGASNTAMQPLAFSTGASNTAMQPLAFNSDTSNTAMQPLAFNSGTSNTAMQPLAFNSGVSNTAMQPFSHSSGASIAAMEPFPHSSGPSSTIVGDVPSTSTGSSEKKKRTRTAFTETQLDQMEMVFYYNNYPDMYSRAEISKLINVNEDRIQVWFQNRRARKKKQIRTGSKSLRFIRREERMEKLIESIKRQQQAAAALSPAAIAPHMMPSYPHSSRGVTICHFPPHQTTPAGLGSSGSTIGTE